jgi:hypothetical protein
MCWGREGGPRRLVGDRQVQSTSVVKAMYSDGGSNCCRGCFLSRYGGGAASKGGSETLAPSARAKSTNFLPPRSWGITFIYMAFVCLSITVDHLYLVFCASYCFFCLSCFSSRPRLVYKSSLSLFSTSSRSSGEAATHVFWPLVICLPSSRSRDSSINPM